MGSVKNVVSQAANQLNFDESKEGRTINHSLTRKLLNGPFKTARGHLFWQNEVIHNGSFSHLERLSCLIVLNIF